MLNATAIKCLLLLFFNGAILTELSSMGNVHVKFFSKTDLLSKPSLISKTEICLTVFSAVAETLTKN